MTVNAREAFPSYSRKDHEFALKLTRDLRAAGIEVWLDQLDIPSGASWDHSVEAALQDASTMLVVLPNASCAFNNVLDEISYALDANKRVVPILIQEGAVPLRLTRLQRVDFTGPYEVAFSRLVLLLRPPGSRTDAIQAMTGASLPQTATGVPVPPDAATTAAPGEPNHPTSRSANAHNS